MALFRFGRKAEPALEPDSPAAAAGPEQAEPAPRGLLDRLRSGLAKTARVLNTDVRDLFKREGRLVDEEFLEELRAALVRTDLGPAAAEAIVVDVRERLRARVVDPEVVVDSIRRQLLVRLERTGGALATAA
ncbi:MAG: signal recognition particle receptor subunit alpha, partial [Planctomycetia bacterium]